MVCSGCPVMHHITWIKKIIPLNIANTQKPIGLFILSPHIPVKVMAVRTGDWKLTQAAKGTRLRYNLNGIPAHCRTDRQQPKSDCLMGSSLNDSLSKTECS